MSRSIFVTTLLLALALAVLPSGEADSCPGTGCAIPSARPAAVLDEVAWWPVLRPADRSLPMGENLVANPGFELGPADRADGWNAYGDGYSIADGEGRGGGRALRLDNRPPTAVHGAMQTIVLDQDSAGALYLGGWSRAEEVTGTVDGSYSVYLDLRYSDGTPLYGQRLDFDVGTHDWQRLERFIVPAKPVRSVSFYCLLRYSHGGTAWFDDLELREVGAPLADFDGTAMAVLARPDRLPEDRVARLATSDGLALDLAAGGTVGALAIGDVALGNADAAHLGGLMVRDVAAGGDVVHLGGALSSTGPAVVQAGDLPEQRLRASTTLSASADRLTWRAAITDTSGADRAVTLYLALPLTTTDLVWFGDLRSGQEVQGRSELLDASAYRGLGASGTMSRSPWAAVARSGAGLAIAVPLDQPRVMRLVANPVTGQLYAAFDLGLSAATTAFPGAARAELALYRFDPAWGLRSAVQGYYDRFPELFRRRFPPDREGIWVAFSDLSPIPRIEEFGIAFHELGSLGQVGFDDSAGIASFRYIAEPWSHWLAVADPAVDPTDYEQAVGYLRTRAEAGDARAQSTLSSAFHDADGRLVYASTVAPWCSGAGGCAVFTVNPDPDIEDPQVPINKGRFEWSEADQATYGEMGLDGEYIDSYLGRATVMDLRRSHMAAADTPLTFRTSDRRVGTPQVFATTEFAKWVTDDVHDSLGRWTMANGMLLDLPWGAELFDFMGTEINWMRSGVFTPDRDDRLLYRRALSYRKPYGMLMNTDFGAFGHGLVERYMQVALFYAIYPSLFSHDASSDRYWDDPALYERDRALFARYIPLVRALSKAGWEPVTRARSDDPTVLVERYGQWPELYIALRSLASEPLTPTLALEAGPLGLPSGDLAALGLVSGRAYPVPAPASGRVELQVPLPSGSTEVLLLEGDASYLPIAGP